MSEGNPGLSLAFMSFAEECVERNLPKAIAGDADAISDLRVVRSWFSEKGRDEIDEMFAKRGLVLPPAENGGTNGTDSEKNLSVADGGEAAQPGRDVAEADDRGGYLPLRRQREAAARARAQKAQAAPPAERVERGGGRAAHRDA